MCPTFVRNWEKIVHIRCMFARHALEARYVCARCSLDLSRRTCNEYPVGAPHVCVGPACSARVCCVHSCVELRAHFCACTKIQAHTANDNERIVLVQHTRRMSNECRRTPSERQRTGQNCYFFSARVMRRVCVTGNCSIQGQHELQWGALYSSMMQSDNMFVQYLCTKSNV